MTGSSGLHRIQDHHAWLFIYGLAPVLSVWAHVVIPPHRSVHSSQTGFLSIPHIRLKTFYHFSFSFIGPSISKGMPPSLCTAKLVHVFGSGLKTSLSETPPNSSILLSFVLYTISGFLHVLQLWTGAWSCIYVVFLCAQLWYLYHMASLLTAQGP